MNNMKKKSGFRRSLASFGTTIGNLFTFKKKNKLDNLSDEMIASPGKTIVRNFFRNKLAILGLVGFIAIFLTVIVGSYLKPVSLSFIDGSMTNVQPGFGYLDVPSKLKEEGIKEISIGTTFAVAIGNEGNLYTWGVNNANALDVPDEVQGVKFAQVAAGNKHIVAIDVDGNFYGWGYNSFNQAEIPSEYTQILNNKEIIDIKAGENYTAVLTDDHNLYVWGSVLSVRIDKIPAEAAGKIVNYTTSTVNILMVLDDGTVALSGDMGNQIGTIPEELQDGSVHVIQTAIAGYTGLALDNNGQVYVWGATSNGLRNVPSALTDGSETVISITGGSNHFTALTESGKVYAWGQDVYGQATVPTGLTDVISVSTGFSQNFAVTSTGKVVAWGNNGYLFGTDDWGRDIFTRLLHGGKVTMAVGAVAVIISTIIGVTIGLISGFYGGLIDKLLMRFAEIISSFPFLPLAITLSAMIGSTLGESQRIALIMAILGFISWPPLARLIRGQILAEREKEFVLAARALGIKQPVIIIKHILPNIINLIIVSMTLDYAGGLLYEASLSFLGFGVLPPNASWGNMLTGAQSTTVIQNYWWRWFIPAVAVLLTALTVNLVGDGLRDAMDPKANEK